MGTGRDGVGLWVGFWTCWLLLAEEGRSGLQSGSVRSNTDAVTCAGFPRHVPKRKKAAAGTFFHPFHPLVTGPSYTESYSSSRPRTSQQLTVFLSGSAFKLRPDVDREARKSFVSSHHDGLTKLAEYRCYQIFTPQHYSRPVRYNARVGRVIPGTPRLAY